MKNILHLLIIVGIVIPQLVFAAWWNPLSWKIFQRQDRQNQLLENRIKELENKLEGVATTSKTSSSSKSVKEENPTNSLINKIVSTKSKSSNMAQPIYSVRDLEKEYKEIVSNYSRLRDDLKTVGPRDSLVDVAKKVELDSEELLRIATISKTVKDIDFYHQRYSQLKEIFNRSYPPLMVEAIRRGNKEDAEQLEKLKNSLSEREYQLEQARKDILVKIQELRYKIVLTRTGQRDPEIPGTDSGVSEQGLINARNRELVKLETEIARLQVEYSKL